MAEPGEKTLGETFEEWLLDRVKPLQAAMRRDQARLERWHGKLAGAVTVQTGRTDALESRVDATQGAVSAQNVRIDRFSVRKDALTDLIQQQQEISRRVSALEIWQQSFPVSTTEHDADHVGPYSHGEAGACQDRLDALEQSARGKACEPNQDARISLSMFQSWLLGLDVKAGAENVLRNRISEAASRINPHMDDSHGDGGVGQ